MGEVRRRCACTPGVVAAGALAVNLSYAFMLSRYRAHGGSLARAAFRSARNDALANVAIIAAGLVAAAREEHAAAMD
jgi:Co/Zn/Cd efflux system component